MVDAGVRAALGRGARAGMGAGAGRRERGPEYGESGKCCGVSGESGSVKCEGFVYIYIDGDGCKGGGCTVGLVCRGKCEGFVFLYTGECEM